MNLKYKLGIFLAATAAPAWAASDEVELYMQKLKTEGEQNWVLNQVEIATRKLWLGDTDAAASSFDDAIAKIELVYSRDPGAVKARSIWHEEGAKTFKGEPYERAMVYYYRGICYLQKADYENARAAFRQGQMQDAFAEEEQNQADFAMLLFLEAWASHLNGDQDLRDETLKQLKTLRSDFPGIAEGDDTLILVETGTAPRKLGDGLDHSYFVFRRGKGFKENRAELAAGGTAIPLFPIEDIYYQATTRGGREIDKILKGKAQFRQNAGGVSSFLASSSVAVSQIGAGGGFAAGAAGLGAIAAIAAFKAKPKADTRQWSSLPDTVHVKTFSSKKIATAGATIRFYAGEAIGAAPDQAIKFSRDPRGAQLALARSR